MELTILNICLGVALGVTLADDFATGGMGVLKRKAWVFGYSGSALGFVFFCIARGYLDL